MRATCGSLATGWAPRYYGTKLIQANIFRQTNLHKSCTFWYRLVENTTYEYYKVGLYEILIWSHLHAKSWKEGSVAHATWPKLQFTVKATDSIAKKNLIRSLLIVCTIKCNLYFSNKFAILTAYSLHGCIRTIKENWSKMAIYTHTSHACHIYIFKHGHGLVW